MCGIVPPMIGTAEAIVLGAIQGLTEFLPVSSSGHLVITQHLFGITESPLLYDVLLHGATFLAIVVVLRRQVLDLLRATLRLPTFIRSWFQKGHLAIGDDPSAWMVVLVLVSTLITGTIGVLFRGPFTAAFGSLPLVAVMLVVTGLLLFLSRNRSLDEGRMVAAATLKDAVIIGLAQSLAILPGLSRSGATITVALFLGFHRKFAGEYSFLISLPAIAGAIILESRYGLGPSETPMLSVIVGFVTAMLLGIVSLKLLLRWVQRGRLTPFAYYCWSVAIFAGFLAFRL